MPKGKDVLRKEVVSEEGFNIADIEENKELIDRTVERLFKEEEFKASEKNKTAAARKRAEDMEKAKEFYKRGGKPKGDNSQSNDENKSTLITPEDKAYLYGAKKMNRTEVRHLEKVMSLTKKPWDKALSDPLYTAWKKENDAVIQRRASSLGASRGGGSAGAKTDDFVKKFSKNLPKGFAYKPKK